MINTKKIFGQNEKLSLNIEKKEQFSYSPKEHEEFAQKILSVEKIPPTPLRSLIKKPFLTNNESNNLTINSKITPELNLLEMSEPEKVDILMNQKSFTFNLPSEFKIGGKENCYRKSFDLISENQNAKMSTSVKSWNGKIKDKENGNVKTMLSEAAPEKVQQKAFTSTNGDNNRLVPQLVFKNFKNDAENGGMRQSQCFGFGFNNQKSAEFKESSRNQRQMSSLLTVRAIKLLSSSQNNLDAKITKALKNGSKFAFQLNLSNLDLSDASLVVLLKNSSVLANKNEINLSNNSITTDGLAILLYRLNELKIRVGSINLAKNQIRADGLTILLEYLVNCQNDLADIDLSKNPIVKEQIGGMSAQILNEGAILKL